MNTSLEDKFWKEMEFFAKTAEKFNKEGLGENEKVKTSQKAVEKLQNAIKEKDLDKAEKSLGSIAEHAERKEKTAQAAKDRGIKNFGRACKSFCKAAGSLIIVKPKAAIKHLKDGISFMSILKRKNKEAVKDTVHTREMQKKGAKTWLEKIKNKKSQAKNQEAGRKA